MRKEIFGAAFIIPAAATSPTEFIDQTALHRPIDQSILDEYNRIVDTRQLQSQNKLEDFDLENIPEELKLVTTSAGIFLMAIAYAGFRDAGKFENVLDIRRFKQGGYIALFSAGLILTLDTWTDIPFPNIS